MILAPILHTNLAETELLRIVLIRATILLVGALGRHGQAMIICICNRVSERDIDNAVIEGASSMCQLNERLRVGTGCGACVEHVRDCLNRCLADDLANMGTQQA
jgi:bacterioferritin-associated ferredoxin